MKQFIFIITLLLCCVDVNASNCEITADLPANERDKQAFILIGEQYLACDMEKGSINFSGNTETSLDAEYVRDDIYIEYHDKKPSRKDKRRAGLSYKDRLLGITYCHITKHQCILVAPSTDLETLGHEVVHAIIGSFHD